MEEIREERIRILNDAEIHNGDYVLYWMQRSQRTRYNHALEYAIDKGNELELPVLVYFGLTENFPDANLRHYSFLLEGLEEAIKNLEDRGIRSVVRKGEPWKGSQKLGKDAALIVTDRGYLRKPESWKKQLTEKSDRRTIQIEGDVVVPVEIASDKEEYAAYTIRDKINEKVQGFLNELKMREVEKSNLDEDYDGLDIKGRRKTVLQNLEINKEVPPSPHFDGGESEARKRLEGFIDRRLEKYGECSNDPTKDCISNLSPYLHFGQISPVEIGLKVKASDASEDSKSEFLEQLIIRRELAINFVHYNSDYRTFDSIDGWARETLEEHRKDDREYTYTLDDFENAETHDKFWNAAQKEMRKTGKMHNYMRMYWGKKILEWTENPEEAYEIASKLNDKYELDGRDPNGYTGVAWCFGKHDRAWKERPIFGKVRYMSKDGLKRKFNAEKYVENVRSLEPNENLDK